MSITNKTKTLVLLDVHAILHRAYHALPNFTSSKGEPTGGLYGLASMLIKIIKDMRYVGFNTQPPPFPAPKLRPDIHEL